MDINFDLFRVFCEVAREKSLSAAAKKLYVSQSAVSQSIKQIENALGAKLFDRKARGVELTAQGKVLFSYADDAYRLLANATEKLEDMKNMKFGNLKIGASDTVCALVLTEALKEFYIKYPDIKLQLVNQTTGQLLNLLRLGQIDMAFITLPVENDEGLNIQKITDINDCFVVSGRYSSLAHRKVDVKELENYPVLMLDDKSSSRKYLDSFLNSKGVSVKPCVELASIDLLARFAQAGIGVSAVIEQYVKDKLDKGLLEKVQLSEPVPTRAVALVTLQSATLSPTSEKFIETVLGEYR